MFRKMLTAMVVAFVLSIGLVLGGLTEELVDLTEIETRDTQASSYYYDDNDCG